MLAALNFLISQHKGQTRSDLRKSYPPMCIVVFYSFSVQIINYFKVFMLITYTYTFKTTSNKLTTVGILVNFHNFMVNNSSLHVKSKGKVFIFFKRLSQVEYTVQICKKR